MRKPIPAKTERAEHAQPPQAREGAPVTRLTEPPDEPPEPQPAISMRIQGGSSAPLRARTSVLSQLTGQLAEGDASELSLIISELVTNSVLHANVGPHQTLTVECATLSDRLRVTVTDPGSRLKPQLRPLDYGASGGYGLRVVESLSSAWGVVRGPTGTTSVWCELPFDTAPPESVRL